MGEAGPNGTLSRSCRRQAVWALVASVVLAVATLGLPAGSASASPLAGPVAGLSAETAAGSLVIEAVADETIPGSSLTLRVANVGDGPVTEVALDVATPEGVEASLTPELIAALPAKTSVLVVVALTGTPATELRRVEVSATGATGSGVTSAVAAIEITAVEPTVTISIAGNTRLTDASPADLAVVLTNAGDERVAVRLRGAAGEHSVRFADEGTDLSEPGLDNQLEVDIPERTTVVVQVRVETDGPVRRGSAALVVTADVSGATTRYDVTATQSLDTSLSSDVLPGIIGLGSVLFVPGLGAVWVWLSVRAREERRRGLQPRSPASTIFDNKLWLLAAAAVSVAAATAYSILGFTDLFDTYALWDIVQLSVICGAVSFVAASVVVALQSKGVPTLGHEFEPEVALAEAAGFSPSNERAVYKTTDGKGLLIKPVGDDVLVLSPPIWFTELDEVGATLSEGAPLTEVVTVLERQEGHRSKIIYAQDAEVGGYISQPQAVRGATPTGQSQVPLLSPRDFDPHNAASTAP